MMSEIKQAHHNTCRLSRKWVVHEHERRLRAAAGSWSCGSGDEQESVHSDEEERFAREVERETLAEWTGLRLALELDSFDE